MVRSGPRRVAVHMTSRTEPPGALVIPPGRIVPGRARGLPPPRREGPAKLTGTAKYADDLVVPGAWYGATIRSTDAHARFIALDQDPDFDWSSVVLVTAADIPGREHRQLDQGGPAGPRAGRRRDPAPRRAAGPARRAGPGHAARRTPRGPRPHRAAAAGLRPARLRPRVRELRHRERRGRRGDGRRRPGPRGRIPRRPPGAAVHREQRDDRGPARGRRRRGPRLAPVPVLRPHRAQAGPRHRRHGRPRSSRRRPAAGSVARRSSPRSSRSTRRSWRSRRTGRSA